MMRHIYGPCAQGEMQIGGTALVVVKMDMFQARPISGKDFVRGVEIGEQVAMADVEVQSDFGERVENLAQLARGIETARQILDHHADAAVAPRLHEFAQAQQIAGNDE